MAEPMSTLENDREKKYLHMHTSLESIQFTKPISTSMYFSLHSGQRTSLRRCGRDGAALAPFQSGAAAAVAAAETEAAAARAAETEEGGEEEAAAAGAGAAAAAEGDAAPQEEVHGHGQK